MFSIRAATDADAHAVATLIGRSFETQAQILGLTPVNCPTYVAFETELGVRRRMASGAQVALAHSNGEAVGTVTWLFRPGTAASGEILRLAVLPPHRGNDYGRRLLEHAENQLVVAGATLSEISIVAQFRPLQGYYERLGYSPTNLKRVPALPFELLYMHKPLGPR